MSKAYEAVSSNDMFGGSLLSFIAWYVWEHRTTPWILIARSRAESNAMLLFGDRVAQKQAAPVSSHLEYPTQPFPSTLSILTSTLTPGLQAVARTGQVSSQLLSILSKTSRWIRCIDPELGQSPSSSDQTFLATFDPRANSAELMRLCRVSDDQHIVERSICQAIYVLHAHLLGWTCRCSGYRRVVEELGHTVRSWSSQPLWDRDLWRWLTMITANAARRGKMQTLQADLMSDLLNEIGSPRDWESLRQAMQTFLYHSKLGLEWKLCWEAATVAVA
jgi:hypothetical protein